ncbi:hypothetical protein COCHEDRAFT_1020753, partial [Bipolaris maydis C5]
CDPVPSLKRGSLRLFTSGGGQLDGNVVLPCAYYSCWQRHPWKTVSILTAESELAN